MSASPRSRRLMQEKCAPAKEARLPSSSGFVENLQNATRAAKRATEEETEEQLTEAAQDSTCAQAVDSNCGEDEDAPEKDDDEEDEYRDSPDGSVRLCPSQFCGLPPTVFFEYPPELRTKRSDASVVEQLGNRRLCYRSYWERVCIRNAFKRAGFERVEKSTSWTALWTKHQPQSVLKELNCLQKHNHFPASWCIGRKDRLTRTLTAMKRIHGSHFDFHPESFVLPGDRVALHKQIKTEAIAVSSSEKKRSSLWIIKPVAASCGKGIKVITAEQALSLPPKKTALVQRYLWDPYLIDGKKFDLRIYVLVAGVDPLRVYIHDEGLTRLSTANYSLKNIKNRFAHLTNYSINKKAEVFKAAGIGSDKIERNTEIDSEEEGDSNEGANRLEIDPTTAADPETEGYKWSLAAFRRWLARKEGQQMMEKTFDKIYDLCLKTMIAAESEITPSLHRSVNFRTNCFELFGCDVILDSQLQPHLLEVNVSPSLMGGSPLDKKIKGTLVADVLHTVGIYPHDPKLLHRFGGRAPDLPSSEHSSSAGANPFAFSSLSKIMCEQGTPK